jgi:excisionase family DNA binding protein
MTETAAVESPWMTRAEAAAYLRVGERTIDRYAEASKLTKHRVEGVQSVRFARSEVEGLVSAEPATE